MKDVADKVEYIGILLSLTTSNEKVTPSQKGQVATILKNYQVPETYLDKVWRQINLKLPLEDLLKPIEEKDNNYKLKLLQDLAFVFLSNGTYGQQKILLNKVASIMGFKVDLEGLKNHVLSQSNKKG
ncbi:hypothetical protein [Desulfotomaculum sp. 1211_IL3151]|uniref:hypothetical protein n=1 Tax=Desulfotomaculum sp. 1211_IL3151 TaxID=3084055 RepID=UPI002FDB7813